MITMNKKEQRIW